MNKTERILLGYRVSNAGGTINLYKEPNGTYTVERSDLYRIYSATPGFKSYKKARAEAECMGGDRWM